MDSRYRIALLVTAVAGTVSCADAPTGSRVVAGLRITTTADRVRIQPGDTVNVRVVARNVSGRTIHIGDSILSCALTLEVRGPGPVNYYRGARLCEGVGASATAPISLAPGDSLVGVA